MKISIWRQGLLYDILLKFTSPSTAHQKDVEKQKECECNRKIYPKCLADFLTFEENIFFSPTYIDAKGGSTCRFWQNRNQKRVRSWLVGKIEGKWRREVHKKSTEPQPYPMA